MRTKCFDHASTNQFILFNQKRAERNVYGSFKVFAKSYVDFYDQTYRMGTLTENANLCSYNS
jgi:hypothetical protein